MNTLLDKYCKMLYFCKSKPSTLSQMSNWELEGILLHIKKYPKGLLNGYDKQEYVNAVNYIIKCRANSNSERVKVIETRQANKALDKANKLADAILLAMLNTENQYKKKLVC